MTLEIVHGAVRRGRRRVLEPGRISAVMPAAVAIVGVNGSGKSSLFMQLTDTLSSRGTSSITVAGTTPSLAYVAQVPAFPAWLRVEHAADLYGLSFNALIADMPGLHLSELIGHRTSALSVGQRQALAIALALGRRADVTLLDEPFAALDFRRRLGAMELLRRSKDEGRAILLSSQSAADLVELCERFVVLRDGAYVFNGMRDELAAAGGNAAVEQRLLELLTMPVPAMEVPLNRR